MLTLARGLAVIESFTAHPKGLTISKASLLAGVNRASTRRCLSTLVSLGYAEVEGDRYRLTPKILRLGNAYSSSALLAAVAQPVLDRLRDQLDESFSLGVLDYDDLLYIGRAEARRIISVTLHVGSRLPAYCTSMGRVLLSRLSDEELQAYLQRTTVLARTSMAVTSKKQLIGELEVVRERGFALVDQELEVGLCSIAVPIQVRGFNASINVGVNAKRISVAQLQRRFLPELRKGAEQIEASLLRASTGTPSWTKRRNRGRV